MGVGEGGAVVELVQRLLAFEQGLRDEGQAVLPIAEQIPDQCAEFGEAAAPHRLRDGG